MDRATTGSELVGREAETAAVNDFLSAIGAGFGALVLEGDPGIGKTTLWLEGVGAARDAGVRVLAARTAPSEATFSFAGLGDLVGGVLDEIGPGLPGPQRE